MNDSMRGTDSSMLACEHARGCQQPRHHLGYLRMNRLSSCADDLKQLALRSSECYICALHKSDAASECWHSRSGHTAPAVSAYRRGSCAPNLAQPAWRIFGAPSCSGNPLLRVVAYGPAQTPESEAPRSRPPGLLGGHLLIPSPWGAPSAHLPFRPYPAEDIPPLVNLRAKAFPLGCGQ